MNKDIQDIQRLLDRFLEGTSTLDEEKRLADYFRTHEVDEEWSAYKEMFAMFDKGEVEVKEKKSRAIPLWVWFATTAVAASIAIVFFLNNQEGKVPSDAPAALGATCRHRNGCWQSRPPAGASVPAG